jgi:hypothetical protein
LPSADSEEPRDGENRDDHGDGSDLPHSLTVRRESVPSIIANAY